MLNEPLYEALQRFRRLQFACDPSLYVGHSHWIDAVALDALKLAAASLYNDEVHRLAALRAGRGRRVFWHGAHARSQARVLPNSLSPVMPRTGLRWQKFRTRYLGLSVRLPTREGNNLADSERSCGVNAACSAKGS